MDNRLKSGIATVLIHVALGYVLFFGLSVPISRYANDVMTLVNLTPPRAPPPPKNAPPPPRTPPVPRDVEPLPTPTPTDDQFPGVKFWGDMTPWEKIMTVITMDKKVVAAVKEVNERLAKWRADVPQGTGPAAVTRVQPSNLATHTLYWPAAWTKGPLPVIAWGNGYEYQKCTNSSLPYAAFLGEIASHGYFIVAVGNDDIEYPQPVGVETLPDGRPVYTRAKALRQAIDWAVAENSRAGSPYQGKLDTSKIAYMGQDCGGGEAMDAGSADPRTTTIVMLNSAARFRPGASETYKAPLAYFDGWQDENSVLDGNDANFTRAIAAEWPIYRATLQGSGQMSPYREPDRRWTRAIVGWLDWQLRGDSEAAAMFPNCTWYCGGPKDGWNRQTSSL